MRSLLILLLALAAPAEAQMSMTPADITPLVAAQQATTSAISGALSREEVAFRNGRGYTISTGRATVASGNVLCLYLENTGTNTFYLTSRLFTHNVPDNVAQPYFFGISGLTGTNLPASTGTATNRNGSAAAPGLVIRYGVSTVALQPGGTVGPGNFSDGALMLGVEFTRTLLPGAKFANCMEGASTGLTGNADAQEAITITAYYE